MLKMFVAIFVQQIQLLTLAIARMFVQLILLKQLDVALLQHLEFNALLLVKAVGPVYHHNVLVVGVAVALLVETEYVVAARLAHLVLRIAASVHLITQPNHGFKPVVEMYIPTPI